MSGTETATYVVRFDAWQRRLHLLLMISFLGLAFSGLPLLFSEQAWARALSRAFGGFRGAGLVHRACALLLFGVFTLHLGRVLRRVVRDRDVSLLWGPSSMVPQPRDVVQMAQHFRWFVGRGPRPAFDRFTYWEKFDYWAVFWGMGVIGASGLLLWFPQFFARFLPGWVFNVALLVHGEEALLAVGFIFTVHFFNGHLRPEKYPMDLVMFTGVVREDELRHERPAEYERLIREGRLAALRAGPPAARRVVGGRIVGTIAVTAGLVMVALIVYALVF
jgi:cytochrome b subunit of formate dehydrogenase